MNKQPHCSVLKEEMIEMFKDSFLEIYVDGTLGAGGHAEAILQTHPEIKKLIGFDQDPEALCIAAKRLEPWKDKVEFVHANFSEMAKVLKEKCIETVDGFFLTLEFLQCNLIEMKKVLVF